MRTSEAPSIQPNASEQIALTVAITKITGVRPKRSANTPASSAASIPVT